MPEEPPAYTIKRLSEEELSGIGQTLQELRHALAAGEFFEAERTLQRPTLDPTTIASLVAEVRRLRMLVKDAATYFQGGKAEPRGGKDERRIQQLLVRLRAEVDR